ncbi:CehA/McbA family metallohydrolase [uncultured Jatrophihabitans sp.]|uniref:CehA/McbA family metallohydrolase n=1 Tax=uncultured Jatrophihabitans sp. TaxID=1610747 RepID=UPI0035C9724B
MTVADLSVSRRAVLASGAVGAAAITLAPMSFAEAQPKSGTATKTITGHLEPGAADFVYLPVRVPRGVTQIAVSYSYSKPSVPPGALSNSCDIGIFDQRGIELADHDGGRRTGFRGWSGGFRTEFAISNSSATPGYLPGPVEGGTWHVVLGPYQVAEQGLDYSVRVTLTYGPRGPAFLADYPPQQIAGRGAEWYRGDCHLHTVYSDGKRTPDQVAAGARAAKLDFMVTTDHNTSASHAVWGQYAADDLLIVTGEEVTTRNGHYLALGLPPGQWIDWRYRARDGVYDDFVRQIHDMGGIAVPAHPYCPYVACRWKFGYDGADAVEVWNGPWTVDDESAVDTWDSMLVAAAREHGRWLPAMGNSDAHSEPQVIGLPHNVVHADRLAHDALVAGIRAGRNWIAESAAVSLAFTASVGSRTAQIGDRLRAAPEQPVRVRADVGGVPNGVVRFITDEGQTVQSSLPATGNGSVEWTTTPSLAAYVRVEVRHPRPDGTAGSGTAEGTDVQLGPMAALSNPIWLGARPSR